MNIYQEKILQNNKSLLQNVSRIAKSIEIPNNLHFDVINGLIYTEIMKIRRKFPNNQPAYRNNNNNRNYYCFIINNKKIDVILYNMNEKGLYKLILSCNNIAKVINFSYNSIRSVIVNVQQSVNQHLI
jgi:hypothetical protein